MQFLFELVEKEKGTPTRSYRKARSTQLRPSLGNITVALSIGGAGTLLFLLLERFAILQDETSRGNVFSLILFAKHVPLSTIV